jgi:hypothetical protein
MNYKLKRKKKQTQHNQSQEDIEENFTNMKSNLN